MGTPLKIILLSDASGDVERVVRALSASGYTPDVRRITSESALSAGLASPPDAIVAAQSLVELSPLRALHVVEQHGLDVPMIILRPNGAEDRPEEWMQAREAKVVVFDHVQRLGETMARALEAKALRHEQQEAQAAVRRREAILSAVGAAAERLLREPSMAASIEQSLAELGRAADISRMYVFENLILETGESVSRQRYEWTAEGVTPQINNPLLQRLPHDSPGFGGWMKRLNKGETIQGHTRSFHREIQLELIAEDIRSVLIVPIFIGRAWWGFIGFDECRHERQWMPAEVDALKAAAGLLGAAVQRKMAEDARTYAETMFRSLVEDSLVGIYIIGSDRRFTYVNKTLANIFGYTRDELLRLDIEELVAEPDRPIVQRNIDLRFRGQSDSARYGFTGVQKDGGQIDVEVFGSLVEFAGHPSIIGTVLDVTGRNRLEREILEISEREMVRIGQDIHDGLGQHLTGIAFLSKVLTQTLRAQGRSEAEEAAQISHLVVEAMSEARALARGLHPVEPHPNGLPTALQELASQVRSLYNVKCEVECHRAVELPDHSAAAHLFRIAQEAVNNAVRHGKAKSILVALSTVPGWILLIVKDDGVGLPDNPDAKGGMGLNIMRYRARVIGASVEVENDPDGGVLVACTLPCRTAGQTGDRSWQKLNQH